MINRCWVGAALTVVVVCLPAAAQPARYDVGRKFIAFEEAWDKQTNPEARRRTTAPLKVAFRSFMSGRLGEAGRAMDEARWALAAAELPADDVRWRDAHVFRLPRVFFDAKQDEIAVTMVQLYDPKVTIGLPVATLSVELRTHNGRELFRGERAGFHPDIAPVRFAVRDIPEGDHALTLKVGLLTATYSVSFVKDMTQRVTKLRAIVDKLPDQGLTTNQRTLTMLTRIFGNLADGNAAETAYPCQRLVQEAEAIAAAPDGNHYDASKSGQFWLTLNTDKNLPAAVRLFVPPEAKDGKPRSIVVAVHGAGGSENLFFDGYGHGEVVRQCAKRGWYCVAPRASFFGVASSAAIVDELAKSYHIDKSRVYIIGHSMGAGQVVSQAKAAPERYAGVAVLGGGSRVAVSEAMKKVPFFIGCGTEDFAIRGAQSLARTLLDAGVAKVEFRDYPDIEHIAVVQVALPEVFQWLEAVTTK